MKAAIIFSFRINFLAFSLAKNIYLKPDNNQDHYLVFIIYPFTLSLSLSSSPLSLGGGGGGIIPGTGWIPSFMVLASASSMLSAVQDVARKRAVTHPIISNRFFIRIDFGNNASRNFCKMQVTFLEKPGISSSRLLG